MIDLIFAFLFTKRFFQDALIVLLILEIGPISIVKASQARDQERNPVIDHIRTPINARFAACEAKSAAQGFPKSQRYVEEIALFLMQSNPEVFTGHFASSEICISIVESSFHGASADPLHGSIEISTTFLKTLSSSAEVSSVIAHELGHLVNNRNNHPRHQPRQVLRDPDFKSIHQVFLHLQQGKSEALIAALKNLETRLRQDRFTDLSKKVSALKAREILI